VVTLSLVMIVVPAQIFAQQSDLDPGGNMLMGPLGVAPRIHWETEYDDNLYRSNEPVSDIISTIGARTDVRTRMRRLGLSLSGGADWVHFSRLMTERGANADAAIRLDFLLTRATPYVTTSYRNSRQRLNPEIDIRPRMQESTFGVGSIVRLGGKTGVDLSANRTRIGYARSYEADGVILEDALNRVSDHVALKLFQEVTPLTHIHVTGELLRHDFEVASPRNADSFRLTTGFSSTGRINGHARAGIRVLRPQDPGVPESRGLYVAVGTSTTLQDRVQIALDAQRDVAPSYRKGAAYYEYYSFGGSMTCAVVRALSLTALVNRRVSDYPTGIGEVALSANQLGIERETTFGSIVRYHIGQSLAIDVAGAYTDRKSTLASRQFDGRSLKVGVSHVF
jgi:hypothetical protein